MSALARLVRPRLVAVIVSQQPAANFSSKDSDSFYKVVKSKIRLDGNRMRHLQPERASNWPKF